jgi:hypothetical protein
MASKSSSQLKVVPVSTPVQITPKTRAVKAPIDPTKLGVIDQIRQAAKPANRMALVVGILLGGLVPIASFTLAHYEVNPLIPIYMQLMSYLVLGGLAYSAKSVYQWGAMAFHDGWKAAGFLVLVEGVMICSSTPWLSYACLAYLVGINAVSTGCNLALKKN